MAQVTTTYLQQLTPDEVQAARTPSDVEVIRAEIPSPELSRFLYATVGGDWFWTLRLDWTRQQWIDYLSLPGVETWIAYLRGTPAGYIELHPVSTSDSTDVEIAYFGLLPAFIGQGLGSHLLTIGLNRAWTITDRWPDMPAVSRVWVHTCDLDGPAALATYQRRGMSIYRTETTDEKLPDRTPGSWPGP